MRFTTNLETDFNDETAVNMESNFSFDLLLVALRVDCGWSDKVSASPAI